MGANGSKSLGTTETEEGRRWKTVETLPNGVKIIEFKLRCLRKAILQIPSMGCCLRKGMGLSAFQSTGRIVRKSWKFIMKITTE